MNAETYRVIDAHCDTLFELVSQGGTLQKNNLCVSLPKLSTYNGFVQFFAAWVDDAVSNPLASALEMIRVFHRELAENKAMIQAVAQATDLKNVFAEHKVGALLTVENGKVLEGSVENLVTLFQLGVRALTLTWNGANELCDGVGEERSGGLSDFGRQVVQEMNRLGMIVDVSHISEQGFWDVIEVSTAPVMASHSNSFFACQHRRNLADDQIRALAEKGGIIGLNLYPLFLTEAKEATLADCLRHIQHIVQIGGEDCLGLGSDFDGFSGGSVKGLAGPEDYVHLFDFLKHAGFSERFIEKIAHKNFYTFLKNALK